MISSRAKTLADAIEEVARIHGTIDQSEAYLETTASLSELKSQLREIVAAYRLTKDRLGQRSQSDLLQALNDIKVGLADIGRGLKANPRQFSEIKRLQSRATASAKRLNDEWRELAGAHVRPHQKVLELVGSLPEIASQRTAIDAAIDRVIALSLALPPDEATLLRYDEDMAWLGSVLHEVEGLSQTVREFLDKVVNRRATLADLSPDIMDWISDRDRSRAFQIRFDQPSGPRSL